MKVAWGMAAAGTGSDLELYIATGNSMILRRLTGPGFGEPTTTTPVPGTVLCAGMTAEDYCDCTGDCVNHPEFCTCAEAQTCC